jgi:glycosyltransferase involved in cell wall biosynthesis
LAETFYGIRLISKKTMTELLSIVIPAKNEAQNLRALLPKLKKLFAEAEIIVVDDGSNDDTVCMCQDLEVKVVSHPYNKGNGAAIKTGTRTASGEYLVFMDADGQHQPEDIERLLSKLREGYDMVVGARSDKSQAGLRRMAGNKIYNKLASWIVGHKVQDLTSGFRAVKKNKFKEFLSLLPNGFSYPTTSTMAFFRAGYSVNYVPIVAMDRKGDSHINIIKDGIRFLLIIFRVGTLYSPLKIFFPVSSGFFMTGLIYYFYTYVTLGRFTNMSALLFITALVVFLIGLVSEQITALMFMQRKGD